MGRSRPMSVEGCGEPGGSPRLQVEGGTGETWFPSLSPGERARRALMRPRPYQRPIAIEPRGPLSNGVPGSQPRSAWIRDVSAAVLVTSPSILGARTTSSLSAGNAGENLDRLEHRHLDSAADVVDRTCRRALHRRDRRLDDIGHVREAARLGAVAEQLERTPFREARDHLRERHVRSLPRPVGVEVPQDDAPEPELACVRVREVLRCELGDPVRGDRPGHGVLGSRIRGRIAVDGGRGGEHGARASRDRCLEEPLAREDVLPYVQREDPAEAPDPRLRSEVEDAVDPGELERVLDQIDSLDRNPVGVLLLQRRVVVVRERVPADSVMAALEQSAEEV